MYLLVLPIAINGFSLVSTTMPYFFAALGLLAALRGTARDGAKAVGNEIVNRENQKG
jgi:predicted ABC-type sugar transport system permease subunit